MKALGIIPARGGSKGVPRKNIRQVAGRPLIAYTINAARASRYLSASVVTTDDLQIAQISEALGCQVIMRPSELAADETPMFPVMMHVLDTLSAQDEKYDSVVLLQPTAPLRTGEDIDTCLEILETSGADSVISVAPVPGHYHPDWQFLIEDGKLVLYSGAPLGQIVPRRQSLSLTFTRNGAIYACRTEVLYKHGMFYSADVRAYVMPPEHSINIDSELDLLLAEALLTQQP